jgi:hypothetical protein
MPGTTRYRGTHVEFALSARLITPTVLNSRTRKVLEFVNHASKLTSKFPKEESSYDSPETRALNRKLAADGCVLLKNDLGVLPVPKNGVKKIALIGSHIKTPAISGGGSAALEPVYTVSLYEAITEKLSGTNIQIVYEPGAYAHKMLPVVERLLKNGKMNFYNEMVEVKDRRWLGSEPLHSLQWQLMDYNECSGLNKLLFYASIQGDFIPDATGIWDFGVTVFGTANLYIDGELIIDNTSVQYKGTAFFGKGTVEEFGSKALVEGRTYKLRIEFGSSNTSRTKDVGTVSFGGGACHIGAALRLDPETMIQRAVKAAEEADFVIVCTGINVGLRPSLYPLFIPLSFRFIFLLLQNIFSILTNSSRPTGNPKVSTAHTPASHPHPTPSCIPSSHPRSPRPQKQSWSHNLEHQSQSLTPPRHQRSCMHGTVEMTPALASPMSFSATSIPRASYRSRGSARKARRKAPHGGIGEVLGADVCMARTGVLGIGGGIGRMRVWRRMRRRVCSGRLATD